jgi:hypothetical protein
MICKFQYYRANFKSRIPCPWCIKNIIKKSKQNNKKQQQQTAMARKKKKLTIEERREENRLKVLSIAPMFPTIGLDMIASALASTKGDVDETIMVLAQAQLLTSANETNKEFEIEPIDILEVEQVEDVSEEEEEEDDEKEEEEQEVVVETENTITPTTPIEQEVINEVEAEVVEVDESLVEQLVEFFPQLSKIILYNALVQCHGNSDDACDYIVSKYMLDETQPFDLSKYIQDDYLPEKSIEQQPEVSFSGGFGSFIQNDFLDNEWVVLNSKDLDRDLEQQDDEEGVDLDDVDDEFDDEEDDEEEEDEDEEEELEVLDTSKFNWFQEALQEQNDFLELQQNDENLARLLQEQEYRAVDFEAMIQNSTNIRHAWKPPKRAHNDDPTINTDPQNSVLTNFHPRNYWPHYEQKIRSKLSYCTNIERIENATLLERFRKYLKNAVDPVVLLAFHGTRSHNIASIKSHGLLIPGANSNISVVNGSALGVGIYLSLDPNVAVRYCYGDGAMIGCAVVVGKKCITTRAGNVIVSFNPAQVLPFAVVRFRDPYKNQSSSTSTYTFRSNSSSSSTRTKKTEKPKAVKPIVTKPSPVPRRFRAKNKGKVMTRQERKEKRWIRKQVAKQI